MKSGQLKIKKQQNSGFSLFTVVVAVSFVGILGLLVLYIALANLQMKLTDLKGKDSFYTAERALEEIRTGLQEDAGDALTKAYTQVMETYNRNSSLQDVSLDKQRQSDFEDLFIKELVRKIQAGTNDDQYDMDHIRSFVDLKYDDATESLIITNPAGSSPVLKKIKKTGSSSQVSGVLLKNLKVIYVDPNGKAAIIRTDIRLSVPSVQFPTPSTLPDLMNMIVVADKGMICQGTESQPSTIKGSIYTGILPEKLTGDKNTSILVDSGAVLNVESGDKVVCKGEISAEVNSVFTSGSGVNLWAKGLNADSVKKVGLLGNTYFADDLTVTGKNNNITVGGNYYGYGSLTSALSEECKFENIYREEGMTGADLSSAIVINGKNTTMDLSSAQKLMIAGKNYIASRSVAAESGKSNTKDIMTGESLTVKGTQIAYLAPTEILGSDSMTEETRAGLKNPMSFDDYLNCAGLTSDSSDSINVRWDTPVQVWGNKTLREIGVDSTAPVQAVFYNDNSDKGYVYFYLNFTDDTKSAEFLQTYYLSNSAVKQNFDKYLSFYFNGKGSGIDLRDPDAYLRYITNGNVLTYAEGQETLQGATSTEPSDKIIQEQIGYQNSWYALNRKMISSYDLLNTNVDEGNGRVHDETDSIRSVYDNLVNENKMVQFIQEKVTDGSLKYEFDAGDENSNLRAIMYHNGSQSTVTTADGAEVTVTGTDTPFEITEKEADKLRLVVCTGDVVIKSGVKFKGIIMAKGTLTLEAGAELESSPLEAARVFQAQMSSLDDSKDGISPQDFFWDGDKYVLGNSTSDNSGDGSNSDTYSVSDCVSYENWKKE